MKESKIQVGMRTPWGPAQHVTKVIPGMYEVETASHGGIKLRKDRDRLMPILMWKPEGWYEEDCNWCLPYVIFEKEILESGSEHSKLIIQNQTHLKTFKCWHPYAYMDLTGKTILPGESYLYDQDVFLEEHEKDYVTISIGGVVNGMVVCNCTIGKSRAPNADQEVFLVPEDEYDARSKFGFVIDEERHKRISK